MDSDDLDDAIRSALPPPSKRRGAWVEPATADDEAVVSLRRTLSRVLENCPGDLSISELRELLEA